MNGRLRASRLGRARTRSLRAMRIGGPIVLVLAALAVVVVVAVQVGGIVERNVSIASRLAATQSDIVALRIRRAEQVRTIRRLSDPAGAIPEIHEKLRLVGPHEEIIYVEGASAPSPDPGGWQPAP